MMGLNWIKMRDRKPKNGQVCLTKMKHGIIQGFYDKRYDNFGDYYGQDMEWHAHEWVPIEDVVSEGDPMTKVEISKIEIRIGDINVQLTVDQARELHQALGGMFGSTAT